jgi:hypothetical protein
MCSSHSGWYWCVPFFSDRILEQRRLDLSALQIERKNLDRFEGSSVPLATATPTGTRALQLRTVSFQTPGQYWIPAAIS